MEVVDAGGAAGVVVPGTCGPVGEGELGTDGCCRAATSWTVLRCSRRTLPCTSRGRSSVQSATRECHESAVPARIDVRFSASSASWTDRYPRSRARRAKIASTLGAYTRSVTFLHRASYLLTNDLQWFNTSHSSSCPLCRSNIF